jgi:hypothetical protein
MTPSANINDANSSSNDTSSSPVQVMLRCDVCGHLVPEQNMAIHRVTRACLSSHQQHPVASALPTIRTQPGNANLSGATAPVDDDIPDPADEDWVPLEHNRHRNPPFSPAAEAEAIASPVHPTSGDANDSDPMEWSRNESHEPETFLATGQAVSRVPVSAVPGGGDEEDEDTKRAARRESTGSVLQVGDVVDLVDNNNISSNNFRGYGGSGSSSVLDDDMVTDDADQWPCPRCTLHNPDTSSVCEACNYTREHAASATGSTSSNRASANGVRAADPVRRERLIPDPFAEIHRQQQQQQQQHQQQQQQQQQHQQEQPPSYMTSGALLGGVLGAAGAYLRGRPVGSAALHGSMTGALSGAVLQEFIPPRTLPTDNRRRRNTSNNSSRNVPPAAAAVGYDATPNFSFAPQGGGNNGPTSHSSPQQVRIMRSRDRNDRQITTVYTSSPVRDGGRRGGNGNGGQVAAGPEDPMLAYIMQSLANSPGGIEDMMRASGGGAGGGFGAAGMGGMPAQDLDGMSYEQLLQRFGDGSENRGADEGTIRSLPAAAVADPSKLPEDCRDCSICLETFEAGMMRKTLPCLHGFHQTCIDKWLRTNGACPICKHHIGS